MSRRGPCFELPIVDALSRAGLKGMIGTACLEGDLLKITDKEGGGIAVPAAEVKRLRVVRYVSGIRPPLHETKIWREGAGEPLLLMPVDPPAYARTVRAFAERVASIRGMGSVMRGPGVVTASINLLLINGSLAFLAAGAVALAAFAQGWGWWALAALLLLLNIAALRDTFRKRWPRRVRSLDELDREFPPKEARP